MHENSMSLMKDFADKYVPVGSTVLDIGSGDINGTYRGLFPGRKYIGVDVCPGKNVDIIMGSKEWDDLSDVDVIISGQTLEHVEDIPKLLNSLYKILKDNGIICEIAPSDGPPHYYPIWVGNFSIERMTKVMTDAGFEIISCKISDVGTWKDCCCIAKKGVVYQKKVEEVIVPQEEEVIVPQEEVETYEAE